SEHHEAGVSQVLVRQIEDDKDQDDHHWQDDAQRPGGPHLVLELAAPLEMYAGWELDLFRHHALGSVDETHDIAVPADVQGNVVAQPAVFALDHGRPFDDAHIGQFSQWDLQRPRGALVFGSYDMPVSRRRHWRGRGHRLRAGSRRYGGRFAPAHEHALH